MLYILVPIRFNPDSQKDVQMGQSPLLFPFVTSRRQRYA